MQIIRADTIKLERYESLIHLVALFLFDSIVEQEVEENQNTYLVGAKKYIPSYRNIAFVNVIQHNTIQELYNRILLLENSKQVFEEYLSKFTKEDFKDNIIETDPINAMIKTASFYKINTENYRFNEVYRASLDNLYQDFAIQNKQEFIKLVKKPLIDLI